MKKLLSILVILCILLPSIVLAGYGYRIVVGQVSTGESESPTPVAWWKFESGALTTDSQGSNTLTDNNTVGTDAVDYKEGSACAVLEYDNTEYFSITDANLDAGFPLKNGDSNKTISVCFWAKIADQTHGTYYIFYKGAANKYSFGLSRSSSASKVKVAIGYNGGASQEEWITAVDLSVDTWYHFGLTYNDSTKTAYLNIWDDTAGSDLLSYASNTFTNNINIEDGPLNLGAVNSGYLFDGKIDDFRVYSTILTEAQIDAIRSGS